LGHGSGGTEESDGVNDQSKHPLEAVWVIGLVLLASLVALAAMGIASPATAAPSAFSTRSAKQIVAAARSAMTAAGSVEARGSGRLTIPGHGAGVAAETNYSGPTSGTQVVAMTSAGTPSTTPLPGASISLVDGALYINANAAFWTTTIGLTASEAPTVASKWVQIPSTSPVYAPVAADMSMPSLVKDLFNSTKFRKGSVRTVDGVKVVPIKYANGGYDSGPTTLYVSTGGRHLPVEASISGITLRFERWGATQAVTTPAGAVPLSSLLPSASSGPPVLA
jgi:hypothetical protein